MRLVTWNIHGGVGRDGRHDLARITALLQDMKGDVAALQEVGDAHHSARETELADQASWMGRRLGWFVAYGPNLVLRGQPYGNAILSRFPIVHAHNYDLSVPNREPRGCLRADLELPGRQQLHLFDLHLGLSGGERRRQAAMLFSADLLRDTALAAPLVLCGDFNMWSPLPGPILRLLRGALRDAAVLTGRRRATYPSALP
ncbi:MAG TPA: endonuclease/exonuclease/phosphatase family protein, partial [Myxococcales bacterium]|nr:endonuclease/exonuclease/phosphatase family protein [Myxococcales bacterium]